VTGLPIDLQAFTDLVQHAVPAALVVVLVVLAALVVRYAR
jgi:hypothetical protein